MFISVFNMVQQQIYAPWPTAQPCQRSLWRVAQKQFSTRPTQRMEPPPKCLSGQLGLWADWLVVARCFQHVSITVYGLFNPDIWLRMRQIVIWIAGSGACFVVLQVLDLLSKSLRIGDWRWCAKIWWKADRRRMDRMETSSVWSAPAGHQVQRAGRSQPTYWDLLRWRFFGMAFGICLQRSACCRYRHNYAMSMWFFGHAF